MGPMTPFNLALTGGAGGAGGPAAGTSNNGLALPMSSPFNFDYSGFMVNFGTQGAITQGGQQGANATQQTAVPTATSNGSGAASAGGYGAPGVSGYGTAGINASMPSNGSMLPVLLFAVGAFLVLGHKL